MYYMKGEVNSRTKELSDATLLWKRDLPFPNLTRYNFTSFAITLNELTPGLKVYRMYCIYFVYAFSFLSYVCLSNCLL